jgi:hypothetical protein
MRKFTVAVAALLVVLAGYGISDAAIVTLSIVPAATQLSADGANGPSSTTYTVYASVTDNTTTDGSVFLNGGLSQFMIDQTYTVGGVITEGLIGHRVAAGPLSQTNAATVIQAPFTALTAPGKLVDATWTASHTGTAGVDNTFGAKALVGDPYDYYTSAAPYELGNNGVPVALYTGTIDAKTSVSSTMTLNVMGQSGQILVYKIKDTGLYTTLPDQVVPASVVIHLGPPQTTADIVINTPDVPEGGWSGPGGWGNNARNVSIDSTRTPSGAVAWTLQNPNAGGSTKTLAETTEDFVLTMGEINSLFGAEVPAAGALPGVNYNWILKATVEGGASDSITVFVPEPATMGLLAFGVFGLLRRRRA